MPTRAGGDSGYPKVTVMILNYNGVRWLRRCLSSVLETEYPKYEIYLIDNGSTDDSVEYVRQKYPSVKFIRNPANLGFAEAYNRAISQVEAEYIVLLNNDVEVLSTTWLDSLIKTANEGTKVGAVATRMVSMENDHVLDSVGSMGVPYWTEGFTEIGRGELDADQYTNSFEPFAFCGGAALIRKSAFIDAGTFDETFFLYYEDPDLSWRLRLRGWRVRYASGARIAHYRGGTLGGGKVTPLMLYYIHRNFLRTIIKNCGASLTWALRNYLLYTFLITSGFLIYEPRKSAMLLKGIVWNIRNLRSSYAARQVVQSGRKVSEQEILRRMYPGLTQKQTARHVALTRIMNVVFDWGGRRKFQAVLTTE